MKRFLLVCSLSLLGFGLMAQEEYERTMNISLAPLKAVAGTASLVYQAKLSDYLALTVPLQFSYHWPVGVSLKLFKVGTEIEETKKPISYGAGLGARFLLAGNGLNDTFYVEPRAAFSYNQLGYTIAGANIGSAFERYQLGPELRFGWDWYYDSGLYVNLGFGLGYSFFLKNDVTDIGNFESKREDKWWLKYVLPRQDALGIPVADIDFALGYSW